MAFWVYGCDAQTKQPRDPLYFDADNEDAARTLASQAGMDVSAFERVVKPLQDELPPTSGKRLTDPVKPTPPRAPFLATFLLGMFGALVGFGVGYGLLAAKVVEGSWTTSLCGGIGFATGSAIARALFHKRD